MRKPQLYSLAKKINNLMPYSKSTKMQFIDVIINNKTDISDIIPNNVNDNNYTPEYIENLKEQIEYHKKEAEKWKNMFLEKIKNIQTNTAYTQPVYRKKQTITECLQDTNHKSPHIEKKKPKNAWDTIYKKQNDKRSLSIRIKENSLIDHINQLPRKDIENMGFKSRKKYFLNQLSLKKKKIDISSVKLKKINVN
jgi:hypothetical protein